MGYLETCLSGGPGSIRLTGGFNDPGGLFRP